MHTRDLNFDHYSGDNSLLRNGYRDQYPSVPLGEEAAHLRELDEIEEALSSGGHLTIRQTAIREARQSAEVLAPEERATTDLIAAWLKGGHIRVPGYILGKTNIVHVSAQSTCVATRFEGKIAYLWGAMPGHRFPDDAIGYTIREWSNVIQTINSIRAYDNMSYLTVKHSFSRYVDLAEKLPVWSTLNKIYRLYGVEGLLQRLFGRRYTAAIQAPNMRAVKGMPHIFIKARKRGLMYGPDPDSYMLCSMDNAVEFMMRSSDAELKHMRLIDLTKELIV